MLTLLVACGSPATVADTAGVDSAAEIVADIPIIPEWTIEEATAKAQAALNAGLPDAPSVGKLYLDLIDVGGDADCPTGDQIGGDFVNGCTSDSGYLFVGHSVWQQTPEGSFQLSGDFEIRTPEARSFYMGGHTYFTVLEGGWTSLCEGTVIFEGADDWFDPGVSAVYSITYSRFEHRTSLDGGFTGSGVSIWFETVEGSTVAGSQPDGLVGIRDPVGAWYWVTMQDATGCGPATFDHADVGNACLDLTTPLLTLEARVDATL